MKERSERPEVAQENRWLAGDRKPPGKGVIAIGARSGDKFTPSFYMIIPGIPTMAPRRQFQAVRRPIRQNRFQTRCQTKVLIPFWRVKCAAFCYSLWVCNNVSELAERTGRKKE
jgi:hypothetical protein